MVVGWNEGTRTSGIIGLKAEEQGHGPGGWRADIYDYARWEYGTEEAARWLLSELEPPTPRGSLPLLARVRKFLHIGARENGQGVAPTARPERHVAILETQDSRSGR